MVSYGCAAPEGVERRRDVTGRYKNDAIETPQLQERPQAPLQLMPASVLPHPSSRKAPAPFVNPFESAHRPLSGNGMRAYVPGQETLRASDFGERADGPRWSLDMMRARGKFIRMDEETQESQRSSSGRRGQIPKQD
jgi:hypothetical protein